MGEFPTPFVPVTYKPPLRSLRLSPSLASPWSARFGAPHCIALYRVGISCRAPEKGKSEESHMAGLKVDLEAQRKAMAKLAFLVGKWEGELRVYPGPATAGRPATAGGPGAPIVLHMKEDASWRLDGLILLIEGVAREMTGSRSSKIDQARPALQAFGFISYDDGNGTYRMRAFNDGRFLESAAKLAKDGKGLEWGFAVEHVSTHAVLRLNKRGEWTEQHKITIGEQPPRKFMETVVRKKV